jgi:hypothetical protein
MIQKCILRCRYRFLRFNFDIDQCIFDGRWLELYIDQLKGVLTYEAPATPSRGVLHIFVDAKTAAIKDPIGKHACKTIRFIEAIH